MDLNTNIIIITLNVNGLNNPIKSQRLSDCTAKKKKNPYVEILIPNAMVLEGGSLRGA